MLMYFPLKKTITNNLNDWALSWIYLFPLDYSLISLILRLLSSDYIYIVIHRKTCFVLSELFSATRQARFLKLGSKPGWLKRQSKILPLSHEETSASEGNLNAYVSHLFLFTYIRELDSYEEPCITLMATIYFPC